MYSFLSEVSKLRFLKLIFKCYIIILEFILFTSQKSYIKAETTDLKHTCGQAMSRCMKARTLFKVTGTSLEKVHIQKPFVL